MHFLRGKFEVDETIKLKGLENCSISEITVLDLRFGAENNVNKENQIKQLHFS